MNRALAALLLFAACEHHRPPSRELPTALPRPDTSGCPATCADRTHATIAAELGWKPDDPLCAGSIGEARVLGRPGSELSCGEQHVVVGCCAPISVDDAPRALAALGWNHAIYGERVALVSAWAAEIGGERFPEPAEDAALFRSPSYTAPMAESRPDGGVAVVRWTIPFGGKLGTDHYARVRWSISAAGEVHREEIEGLSIP